MHCTTLHCCVPKAARRHSPRPSAPLVHGRQQRVAQQAPALQVEAGVAEHLEEAGVGCLPCSAMQAQMQCISPPPKVSVPEQNHTICTNAHAPDARFKGAFAACSLNVVKMRTRCCCRRRRCATLPISSSREASSQAGLVASGQAGVLAGRRGTAAPGGLTSPRLVGTAVCGWVRAGTAASSSTRPHVRSLRWAVATPRACTEEEGKVQQASRLGGGGGGGGWQRQGAAGIAAACLHTPMILVKPCSRPQCCCCKRKRSRVGSKGGSAVCRLKCSLRALPIAMRSIERFTHNTPCFRRIQVDSSL